MYESRIVAHEELSEVEIAVEHKDTPHWTDGCMHVEDGDTYCGSVAIDNKWYDVYTYRCRVEGIGCCFRYGNEDSEYISPGGLAGAVIRHREEIEQGVSASTSLSIEQLAKHVAVYRECLELIMPGAFGNA